MQLSWEYHLRFHVYLVYAHSSISSLKFYLVPIYLNGIYPESRYRPIS